MEKIPNSGLFKCGCCGIIIPTKDDSELIEMASNEKIIFMNVLCKVCSKRLIDTFNEKFIDLRNE